MNLFTLAVNPSPHRLGGGASAECAKLWVRRPWPSAAIWNALSASSAWDTELGSQSSSTSGSFSSVGPQATTACTLPAVGAGGNWRSICVRQRLLIGLHTHIAARFDL